MAAPQAPPGSKMKKLQRRRRCQEQEHANPSRSVMLCPVLTCSVPFCSVLFCYVLFGSVPWGRGVTPQPPKGLFTGSRSVEQGQSNIFTSMEGAPWSKGHSDSTLAESALWSKANSTRLHWEYSRTPPKDLVGGTLAGVVAPQTFAEVPGDRLAQSIALRTLFCARPDADARCATQALPVRVAACAVATSSEQARVRCGRRAASRAL
eukprot:gene1098-biopygen3242